MPGVQPPVGVPLQVAPMFRLAASSQFVPLQQTLGVFVLLHVRFGPQPPLESQRHPCVPARQVDLRLLPLALSPPPHTLGVPGLLALPQPQHCGAVQPPVFAPQAMSPPQPADMTPQFWLPQVGFMLHATGH